MADYEEETGGSAQERKEEQEWFDRDLTAKTQEHGDN